MFYYLQIQNLKDKYENLKRKTIKIEGDRKKDVFKTGGGSSASRSVAPSATHDALLQVLGVSAVGLDNPFDGDKPGNLYFTVSVYFVFCHNLSVLLILIFNKSEL